MTILRLIAAATLCLATSILPANAQDDSGRRGSTMRVITFGGQLDSVYYDDKESKSELFAGPGSFSSEMPIPKDRVLKLYHKSAAPEGNVGDATPPTYRPVGSVQLPSGSEILVVLGVPLDLTKDPTKGRAYKDSRSNHRALKARVFNLTPKEVAVRAGDGAVSLKPGEEGMMPWKPVAYNSVAYQVAIRKKDSAKWQKVESGEGVSREDLRMFLFIIEDLYEDVRTVAAMTVPDPIPFDEDE